jgi:aspartyl-tRNA synthetase
MSNIYRTHTSAEISEKLINQKVKVAGWIENIRDHGGIIFLDLRDHYGYIQIVVHNLDLLTNLTKESAVTIEGTVIMRDKETYNDKIATGTVEINAETLAILGKASNVLPFEIPLSTSIKEDIRLKYRYLDLRNRKVHDNIVLRSKVISRMRQLMTERGFLEIQTPILTASSPEGARDFIIPSRIHQGKFYALPQAPQIFKQLLMVSGFDKYFQIAPCFRDEDARADRSPGEFYQLDFEMSFATQEDVFAIAEPVVYDIFTTFTDKEVTKPPFVRIPYRQSMLEYGSDKPDLRNPLKIIDITKVFEGVEFPAFKGKIIRAIVVPDCTSKPKSFYEYMGNFALSIGMKGLGYIKVEPDMVFNGPITKFLSPDKQKELIETAQLKVGCTIFFIADKNDAVAKFAGQIRTALGEKLGLIDENCYKFCFITDFPMYEIDEETGEYIFTHNPFSMPQGGLEALNTKKPDEILAYQYDIVCNGVELSSGAVRNHEVETMIKAFAIAGYTEDVLKSKFPSLYNAFQYGAPPHAGMAPGVDRIIMLLTGEKNIREVIAFPMNNNAQDMLMGAPNEVTEKQLREAHIKLR